jgi:hypothetical protein
VYGPLPETEAGIVAFVGAFENCTLPKTRWTHGAHVLTGAWYVHALGEAEAMDQMRRCVRRYNESVGGKNTATSGYHETVTWFWIKLLAALYAAEVAAGRVQGRAAFALCAAERFGGSSGLHREYYDFDIMASSEARLGWVAPVREIHIPPASGDL